MKTIWNKVQQQSIRIKVSNVIDGENYVNKIIDIFQ